MPTTQVNFHVVHRSGTNPLQLQGTAGTPIQSVHTLHIDLNVTATQTTGSILEGAPAGTLTADQSDFNALSNPLQGLPFDVTLFGGESGGNFNVTSIALGNGFAAHNVTMRKSDIREIRPADAAVAETALGSLGKAGTRR